MKRWYEYGYEGFPSGERRRRFFRQRDDPCDSQEDLSGNDNEQEDLNSAYGREKFLCLSYGDNEEDEEDPFDDVGRWPISKSDNKRLSRKRKRKYSSWRESHDFTDEEHVLSRYSRSRERWCSAGASSLIDRRLNTEAEAEVSQDASSQVYSSYNLPDTRCSYPPVLHDHIDDGREDTHGEACKRFRYGGIIKTRVREENLWGGEDEENSLVSISSADSFFSDHDEEDTNDGTKIRNCQEGMDPPTFLPMRREEDGMLSCSCNGDPRLQSCFGGTCVSFVLQREVRCDEKKRTILRTSECKGSLPSPTFPPSSPHHSPICGLEEDIGDSTFMGRSHSSTSTSTSLENVWISVGYGGALPYSSSSTGGSNSFLDYKISHRGIRDGRSYQALPPLIRSDFTILSATASRVPVTLPSSATELAKNQRNRRGERENSVRCADSVDFPPFLPNTNARGDIHLPGELTVQCYPLSSSSSFVLRRVAEWSSLHPALRSANPKLSAHKVAPPRVGHCAVALPMSSATASALLFKPSSFSLRHSCAPSIVPSCSSSNACVNQPPHWWLLSLVFGGTSALINEHHHRVGGSTLRQCRLNGKTMAMPALCATLIIDETEEKEKEEHKSIPHSSLASATPPHERQEALGGQPASCGVFPSSPRPVRNTSSSRTSEGTTTPPPYPTPTPPPPLCTLSLPATSRLSLTHHSLYFPLSCNSDGGGYGMLDALAFATMTPWHSLSPSPMARLPHASPYSLYSTGRGEEEWSTHQPYSSIQRDENISIIREEKDLEVEKREGMEGKKGPHLSHPPDEVVQKEEEGSSTRDIVSTLLVGRCPNSFPFFGGGENEETVRPSSITPSLPPSACTGDFSICHTPSFQYPHCSSFSFAILGGTRNGWDPVPLDCFPLVHVDTTTWTWTTTQVKATGDIPRARYGHSATTLPPPTPLCMGEEEEDEKWDMEVGSVRVEKRKWGSVADMTRVPAACKGGAARKMSTTTPSLIVIVGGIGKPRQYLCDIHMFNSFSCVWREWTCAAHPMTGSRALGSVHSSGSSLGHSERSQNRSRELYKGSGASAREHFPPGKNENEMRNGMFTPATARRRRHDTSKMGATTHFAAPFSSVRSFSPFASASSASPPSTEPSSCFPCGGPRGRAFHAAVLMSPSSMCMVGRAVGGIRRCMSFQPMREKRNEKNFFFFMDSKSQKETGEGDDRCGGNEHDSEYSFENDRGTSEGELGFSFRHHFLPSARRDTPEDDVSEHLFEYLDRVLVSGIQSSTLDNDSEVCKRATKTLSSGMPLVTSLGLPSSSPSGRRSPPSLFFSLSKFSLLPSIQKKLRQRCGTTSFFSQIFYSIPSPSSTPPFSSFSPSSLYSLSTDQKDTCNSSSNDDTSKLVDSPTAYSLRCTSSGDGAKEPSHGEAEEEEEEVRLGTAVLLLIGGEGEDGMASTVWSLHFPRGEWRLWNFPFSRFGEEGRCPVWNNTNDVERRKLSGSEPNSDMHCGKGIRLPASEDERMNVKRKKEEEMVDSVRHLGYSSFSKQGFPFSERDHAPFCRESWRVERGGVEHSSKCSPLCSLFLSSSVITSIVPSARTGHRGEMVRAGEERASMGCHYNNMSGHLKEEGGPTSRLLLSRVVDGLEDQKLAYALSQQAQHARERIAHRRQAILYGGANHTPTTRHRGLASYAILTPGTAPPYSFSNSFFSLAVGSLPQAVVLPSFLWRRTVRSGEELMEDTLSFSPGLSVRGKKASEYGRYPCSTYSHWRDCAVLILGGSSSLRSTFLTTSILPSVKSLRGMAEVKLLSTLVEKTLDSE